MDGGRDGGMREGGRMMHAMDSQSPVCWQLGSFPSGTQQGTALSLSLPQSCLKDFSELVTQSSSTTTLLCHQATGCLSLLLIMLQTTRSVYHIIEHKSIGISTQDLYTRWCQRKALKRLQPPRSQTLLSATARQGVPMHHVWNQQDPEQLLPPSHRLLNS